MRGKSKFKVRRVEPDSKFQSTTISKFINYVMDCGKKSIAQRIVYESLDLASKESKLEPLDLFNKLVQNVAPNVEVKSRRIGGANYQVPMEVKEPRRTALALRWVILGAKSKRGTNMAKRLSQEYLEALNNTGFAVKKKVDTHKMAEANRAFAHFARMK